jgi:hypothetical protein
VSADEVVCMACGGKAVLRHRRAAGANLEGVAIGSLDPACHGCQQIARDLGWKFIPDPETGGLRSVLEEPREGGDTLPGFL